MSQDTVSKSAFAPVVLRLALAAIFIYNGVIKVTGKDGDWGAGWAFALWAQQQKLPAGLSDKMDTLTKDQDTITGEKAADIKRIEGKLARVYADEAGTPPETLRFAAAQLAVAWGELLCGVLLLLGLLTRGAALLMILVQVGAIYTVTWAKGFSSLGGGYETNVALLAMCLALLISGGGACSLDRWWTKRRHQQRAAAHAGTPGAPVAV